MTLITVLLLCGFVLWMISALARLQKAWEISQQRTSELRLALTAAGRKLLRDMETMQRLDGEAARIRENAAAAARDQKERQATLARTMPPAPPEIHLTSEYPPTRRDTAWIIEFVRDSAMPRQPWEREPPTSLVWAPSQSAAFDRGHQIVRSYKTYSVAGARPLT